MEAVNVGKSSYDKGNPVLAVAALLLWLVLLSTWLLSGISARFASSAGADDSARVAIFSVTDTATMSQSFAVEMKPGDIADDSNKFEVQIQNNSEVKVRYIIGLETEGNLPLEIAEATGYSDLQPITSTGNASGAGGNVTYQTTRAVGQRDTSEYKFYLKWPDDENSYAYSEGVESIVVTVTAVQED